MNILLFGGTGQLGHEVISRARALNFGMVAPVESELDIADPEAVDFIAQRSRPDLVINCAAYTAVDKAESDSATAFRVNRDGASNIAGAAKRLGVRMLHISTDYVFDGSGTQPLTEEAPVCPINVYGASKLAGEQIVGEILGKGVLVVRTSSLHGQRGNNFVHTMLKLFAEREVVRVVSDQIMCATWAGWLAEVLLDLGRLECHGIVHACGSGAVSWYEFAGAIYDMTRKQGGWKARLETCSAKEYPLPAKRPAFSVMDCTKLTRLLGRPPISWRQGLLEHLKEVGY